MSGVWRDLALDLLEAAGNLVAWLSALVAGVDADTVDRWRVRIVLMQRRNRTLRAHPCPACRGDSAQLQPCGLVEVCPACLGFGVDVAWLATASCL